MFWIYTYKESLKKVITLQGPEDMDKTEREKFAVCLPECFRKGRYSHCETHYFIIFVQYNADQVSAYKWEILIYIILNLLIIQSGIFIQDGE